jgi:hypothetical protein
MDSIKDAVAYWATVLGTLIGLFGLFQSRAWVASVGAVVAAFSIGVLIYAAKQRSAVKSAALTVGDRSIDSLNVAGLQRRLNRSLVMQHVQNLALIDGGDLTVIWKCSGYCQSQRETAIEFSIDADTNIPFGSLDCFAIDLKRDPRHKHPIRPILLGPDGISKKISVPFLAPLSAKEPFSVMLKYRLPSCLRAGIDYYTATLSFAQDRIPKYSVRLRFAHGRPQWVRVYERRDSGGAKLLKDLRPRNPQPDIFEYADNDGSVPAQCARIYMFSRSSIKESR